MARKTLDEQLLSTQQEIKEIEEQLNQLRQKEKSVKEQIENRNMSEYYAFIKSNNLSMADLEKLVGKANSKSHYILYIDYCNSICSFEKNIVY